MWTTSMISAESARVDMGGLGGTPARQSNVESRQGNAAWQQPRLCRRRDRAPRGRGGADAIFRTSAEFGGRESGSGTALVAAASPERKSPWLDGIPS